MKNEVSLHYLIVIVTMALIISGCQQKSYRLVHRHTNTYSLQDDYIYMRDTTLDKYIGEWQNDSLKIVLKLDSFVRIGKMKKYWDEIKGELSVTHTDGNTFVYTISGVSMSPSQIKVSFEDILYSGEFVYRDTVPRLVWSETRDAFQISSQIANELKYKRRKLTTIEYNAIPKKSFLRKVR